MGYQQPYLFYLLPTYSVIWCFFSSIGSLHFICLPPPSLLPGVDPDSWILPYLACRPQTRTNPPSHTFHRTLTLPVSLMKSFHAACFWEKTRNQLSLLWVVLLNNKHLVHFKRHGTIRRPCVQTMHQQLNPPFSFRACPDFTLKPLCLLNQSHYSLLAYQQKESHLFEDINSSNLVAEHLPWQIGEYCHILWVRLAW